MKINTIFTIITIALPVLIFGAILFILFLIFGIPFLIRLYIKNTGILTDATILEVKTAQGSIYSGGSSHNLVAPKVILKLEVHPKNGAPYIAEDHFITSTTNFLRLSPGCNIQVRVAANNPSRIVCLPQTINASADSPLEARVNNVMADLIAQGKAGSPQAMEEAFQAAGIHSQPATVPDDPEAKLEKLKEMLISGLITQQDFDAKKVEILSRM